MVMSDFLGGSRHSFCPYWFKHKSIHCLFVFYFFFFSLLTVSFLLVVVFTPWNNQTNLLENHFWSATILLSFEWDTDGCVCPCFYFYFSVVNFSTDISTAASSHFSMTHNVDMSPMQVIIIPLFNVMGVFHFQKSRSPDDTLFLWQMAATHLLGIKH